MPFLGTSGPFLRRVILAECRNLKSNRRSYINRIFGGSVHFRPLSIFALPQPSPVIVRPQPSHLTSFRQFNTGTGQQEDSQKQESDKRRRNYTKWGFAFFAGNFGLVGLLLLFEYGPPQKDDKGEIIIDEFHEDSLSYLWRTEKKIKEYIKSVKEPSRDLLLPDPLKPPYYQPKYTVVLEASGVILCPEHTLQSGWRFKVRPAADYFLRQMKYPNFELVIYTDMTINTADDILNQLDPQMEIIMHRLYRTETNYMKGHHIKDLSRLNRDLSKVIYVDWDPKSFQLNPENALCVPKWTGDESDTSLVDLAELIKTIASLNVEDVRPVLEHYSNFDDPSKHFREQSMKFAEDTTRYDQQSQAPAMAKGIKFGLR